MGDMVVLAKAAFAFLLMFVSWDQILSCRLLCHLYDLEGLCS